MTRELFSSSDPIGPGGNASTTACAAGLANTILGAGILGLPYAFTHCGLPLGLLLLAVCAAACCTSLHLLALSARTSGVFPASFYTVASASIPKWAFAIDLAVAIKCFGVATSYLIVVGDLMPTVMAALNAPIAWQARKLWVTAGVLIAGPLSCAARLEVLKLSSLLAICCIVYLAVLSLVVLAEPHLACSAPSHTCRGLPTARPDASVLKVVSIFIFGFTCQQNIFSIVNELHTPHIDRLNRVICAAVFLALTMYTTVALAGYLTYGSKVEPDLLVNYPDSSPWFLAARAGISIVVVCAYPLQAHPSRKCALTLFRAMSAALVARRALAASRSESSATSPLNPQAEAEAGGYKAAQPRRAAQQLPDEDYTPRFWLYTLLFVLASWRIALGVSNLGKVMAVVGATGSTSVSYILPGACYWRLHPYPHAKRYVAGGLFCLGVLIIPTALHSIFT